MKIISWNTNGLRATIKQGYFEPLFLKYKPDIVCFQETKCEPNQLEKETLNYKDYFSHFAYSKNKKGYSGVAVYSKIKPVNISYGIGIEEFDIQGRTLVLYYKDFILINCYFPNGGGGPDKLKYKLDFYDAFLEFVNKLKKTNQNIIICGDVNVAHEEIDIARPKENENHVGFLPIERDWFDTVMNNGWIDVFRYLNPNKKDVYTYWDIKSRARDRNVGWRIDYFITTVSFIGKIKSFKTLSDYYGSDHCPIMVEL